MKKRLETLLKLGIFAAIAMYFANKFVESSALLRKLLKNQSGQYYHWSHGSVYYTKQGTGDSILLIHDLHSSSSGAEWQEIVQKLSRNHTVYVMDLPGCGRSCKPHITYINYFFVQLLHDFVTDIIQTKAQIMATGISGSFAVMAAQIYPDLFGKLTLVNPLAPEKLAVTPTHGAKYAKAIMDCPILGTFLYYIFHSENEIEYNFTENYFYNPFLVSSKLEHTYYESAHWKQGSGRFLLSSIHCNYVNTNISVPFSKLNQEIHLILGKEMPNAATVSSAYQALRSNINVSFIEKTKLLPQLEAPIDFLSACI